MRNKRLVFKIAILFLLVITSFAMFRNQSFVLSIAYILVIQALFILSLRFYSLGFLLLYFVLSAVVILFSPELGLEGTIFKYSSLALYFFIGYLAYFALKSIEDEFSINKSFVLEEQQNLAFKELEYKLATEKKSVLEGQSKELQFLSSMLNKALVYTSWQDITDFFANQTSRLFMDSIVIFSEKNTEKNDSFCIRSSAGMTGLTASAQIDNLDEIISNVKTPLLVENIDRELKYKLCRNAASPFEYHSLIAVPVPIDEKRSGIIKAYHKKANNFNTNHLRLLQYISEMLSMLLLNAALYERTEKLARTDGITGLYVQHYFMEKIQEEIYRARKHGSVFSLIMLDIDNFKQVNDTYGHQAGDFILVKTSDYIKVFIRSIDFPCRYGGDEFFIILPETDSKGAAILAERIRKKICDETKQMGFMGQRFDRPITISAGYGQYKPEMGDHKEFIAKIDAFMYQAKHHGKNKVMGDLDAV